MSNSKKITRREKREILGKNVQSTYNFLSFLTFWHCLLFKEIVLTGDGCITDIKRSTESQDRVNVDSEGRQWEPQFAHLVVNAKARQTKGWRMSAATSHESPSFFNIFYRVFSITNILLFCQTMVIIRGTASGPCSVRLLLLLACLKADRVHRTEHPGSRETSKQVEKCLQMFQVGIFQAWLFSLNSQHLTVNTVHPYMLHKNLSLDHFLMSQIKMNKHGDYCNKNGISFSNTKQKAAYFTYPLYCTMQHILAL